MSLLHPALAAPRLALEAIDTTLPYAAILDDEVAVDFCIHLRPIRRADETVVDLYWSSLGFTSDPDDTPASQHFGERVVAMRMTRRLASAGDFGGRADLRSAEIEAVISDGIEVDGVTYTPRAFRSAFSIVGREVEVRMVGAAGYAAGKVFFRGTADDWDAAGLGRLVIALRGKALALDTPVQPATYGGTGGTDGTEDLAGKFKPFLLGRGLGLRPVLEDPTVQLWRVHCDADGNGAEINAIERVQLGGTDLTFAGDYATTAALLAATWGSGGADIEPGEFATCLAEGAFRLGTDDYNETITADVQGAVIGGVYLERPGAIARALLMSYGARLAASELVGSTFTTLDSDFPHPVHLWVGPADTLTAADALDLLMFSIGGTWTDRPDGRLAAYRVARASNTPLLTVDDGEIFAGSWEWVALPRSLRPALSEVTIGHTRNYTVRDELRGGATAADRAFFAQAYRTAVRTQALTGFAETAKLRRDTQIGDSAGAETLGDAILAVNDGTVDRARFDMGRLGFALAMASVIRVTHAEAGVSGQLARVIGLEIDTARERVTPDILLEPES